MGNIRSIRKSCDFPTILQPPAKGVLKETAAVQLFER
jgi:hypothetical protein